MKRYLYVLIVSLILWTIIVPVRMVYAESGLSVGDTVNAKSDIAVYGDAIIWSNYGPLSRPTGTVASGSQGLITDGPRTTRQRGTLTPKTWWKVEWTGGVTGWSKADNLEKVAEETPEPRPVQINWLAEYFNGKNNINVDETPTFTRYKLINIDGSPVFLTSDWSEDGPGNGVSSDNFSVRWTGKYNFNAGIYCFAVDVDDGVKVAVDGITIINEWRDQSQTRYLATYRAYEGEHEIQVSYYQNTGSSYFRLWCSPISEVDPDLWCAQYFNNTHLFGNPVVIRGEPYIDNNWGNPDPYLKIIGVNSDNFSVMWTKKVYFDSGDYLFKARADDGIIVSIDGKIIINDWTDHSAKDYSVSYHFNASKEYEIKVKYYEHTTTSVVSFYWIP